MSVRTCLAATCLLFLVACGAPAAKPTPTAPAPPVEPAEPIAMASEDGLYACRTVAPDQMISVSMKADITLRDLVTWYVSASCAKVVILVEHEDRTRAPAVDGKRITGAELEPLFLAYLDEMGLAAIRDDHDILLIVDEAWLAPGPRVVRVARLEDERPVPDLADDGPPAAPTDGDALTARFDAEIVVIDDLHRTVSRALLDTLAADPMAMAGARVVPSVKNGTPDGFKLYAIRPSSFYARVGLANGDTITAVNGIDLASLEDGLNAYQALRDQRRFEVSIVRRGKPIVLVIDIVD
jgi:hypothetical protein